MNIYIEISGKGADSSTARKYMEFFKTALEGKDFVVATILPEGKNFPVNMNAVIEMVHPEDEAFIENYL